MQIWKGFIIVVIKEQYYNSKSYITINHNKLDYGDESDFMF